MPHQESGRALFDGVWYGPHGVFGAIEWSKPQVRGNVMVLWKVYNVLF